MRSVPRGTLCAGVIVCIIVYVYSPYYEETKTSYAAPTAKEDFPAAGFGGRGQVSAGIAAGVAEILSADQEADYFASGRRRSGVVPKTGAGLPDEDQSGAAEVDDGREKELALPAPGLERRQNGGKPAGLQVFDNAQSSGVVKEPLAGSLYVVVITQLII